MASSKNTPAPPPAAPSVLTGVMGEDLDALEKPARFVPTTREVDERIVNWVEHGFQHWDKVSKDWRTVTLSSEEAANKIVDDARHYAGKIREVPLTVQVRSVVVNAADGTAALAYRIRTRVASGRKPSNS